MSSAAVISLRRFPHRRYANATRPTTHACDAASASPPRSYRVQFPLFGHGSRCLCPRRRGVLYAMAPTLGLKRLVRSTPFRFPRRYGTTHRRFRVPPRLSQRLQHGVSTAYARLLHRIGTIPPGGGGTHYGASPRAMNRGTEHVYWLRHHAVISAGITLGSVNQRRTAGRFAQTALDHGPPGLWNGFRVAPTWLRRGFWRGPYPSSIALSSAGARHANPSSAAPLPRGAEKITAHQFRRSRRLPYEHHGSLTTHAATRAGDDAPLACKSV